MIVEGIEITLRCSDERGELALPFEVDGERGTVDVGLGVCRDCTDSLYMTWVGRQSSSSSSSSSYIIIVYIK